MIDLVRMYLNVIQLAESLGVEESVIEGWVRNDHLPHVADRGRLLFDRAQVTAWAASRGLAARAGFLAPGVAPGGKEAKIQLEPLLRRGGIWRAVDPSNVFEILEAVLNRIPGATPSVRQMLGQRLRASGGITWAPIGAGIALPHLRSPVALGRDAGILAFIFLDAPISLKEPAPDNFPITRLLFFMAPSPRAHLELLALLSAALAKGNLRSTLAANAPDAEIFAVLAPAQPRSAGNTNLERST